jgi:hypothetical protein
MAKLLNNLKYVEPRQFNDQELIEILNSNLNYIDICEALISLSLNSSNKNLIKKIAFKFANNENLEIASSAITAIGHCARRFSNIDLREFKEFCKKLKNRKLLSGVIDDTCDDIKIFNIKNKQGSSKDAIC